jgi:exosortase
MNLRTKSIDTIGLPDPGTQLGYSRAIGFALLCVLPLALAWDSMRAVAELLTGDSTFSQAPVIPVVSAFLIYMDRRTIFSKVSFSWILGSALIVPGMMAVAGARFDVWGLSAANQFSLLMFGIMLAWAGAFILCFGTDAMRAASFPLGFLILAVPIPEPVLSKIISLLQEGSADVAEWFFKLGGIPYLRQGFDFALPGFTIRVADECSGIRSSLALLVTIVLASHLFLRTTWRRLVLCAVVVPLAIFKNGLRIMTLSTLAIYVNPEFLYGNLHRRGGVVFFAIALVPLVVLLAFLQRSEKMHPATGKGTSSPGS